jgi:two-component system, OmpR family, sensor kinase
VLSRAPLWARLVLCALGLAAVGLTVTSVVGIDLFRSYLVDQNGEQLTTVARTIATAHGDRPLTESLTCGDLPNDNAVELIGYNSGPATTVFASCDATVGQDTALPARPAVAQLAAAADSGQPFTETGTVGSTKIDWQLVVVRVPIRVQLRPEQPPLQITRSTAYTPAPAVTPTRSAPGYVLAATPLTGVDSTVSHLADLDLAVDAAVGLALLGLGYVLVRRTLRPLRRIETAAAAISAGDLARRVPPGHPKTETGRLSLALNGMLAQIEAAFGAQARSEAEALSSEAHMRRFAADAGHELRTPLASIRGITELYRQGAADSRQLPDLIGRIEGEAIRMSLLVEDLLLLARLGEARPAARDRVHLVALAADSIIAARSRARDRAIDLCVDWPEDVGEEEIELEGPVTGRTDGQADAAGAGAVGVGVGAAAGTATVTAPVAAIDVGRPAESKTADGFGVHTEIPVSPATAADADTGGSSNAGTGPDTGTGTGAGCDDEQPYGPAPTSTPVPASAPVGEPVVIGDENRLRQALDNLLTNAVHHTPPGTPITVRVRPGEQPGRCLLEVADTGPGLSEQDAARVFERFYRADRSRTRTTAQQGSGLGLAIVAAIAGAHGGSASVRSGSGVGACFTLDLPQAPATDEEH